MGKYADLLLLLAVLACTSLAQVIPSNWTCPVRDYNDGFCSCNCGAYDKEDCDGSKGSSLDCFSNEICSRETGKCTSLVSLGWTCSSAMYGEGVYCHCGCGIKDPDCDDIALPVSCEMGAVQMAPGLGCDEINQCVLPSYVEHIGAIIGGVVGGIALLCMCCCACAYAAAKSIDQSMIQSKSVQPGFQGNLYNQPQASNGFMGSFFSQARGGFNGFGTPQQQGMVSQQPSMGSMQQQQQQVYMVQQPIPGMYQPNSQPQYSGGSNQVQIPVAEPVR